KAMLMTKLKVAGIGAVLGLFLLLGGVVGRGVPAADKPPASKEAEKLRDTILVLDQQFWEAAGKHDTDPLNRLIAADYVGLGHEGVRWTKAAILEQYKQVRTDGLKRTTEREVFRVHKHAAILTYEAKFRVLNRGGQVRDTAHQRLTSCWVQRDGGWFVVFSQV